MAVQWLGNVKQTGRGNLAKDIGESVQPAVNAYSDYLSKTQDREKAQVDAFITEIKKSSGKERESLWTEFQTHPEFRKTVEEQASWVLGEGKFNVAQKWEKVGVVGTKMIVSDGDTTKAIEMGEDFDTYKLDYRKDGTVMKVNQRTGVGTLVDKVKEIYSTSNNTINLDNGKVMTVHRITYTDGIVDETRTSAGVNAELKGLEMSIEARAELATLDREAQDEWKTKEFQNKKDILAFNVTESLRDQKNIEAEAKTDKEKFDSKLAEGARQFDVGAYLNMYELRQNDDQFQVKMEHQIKVDMKKLGIKEEYTDALIQDLTDKINLAHDKFDLSKVKVNQDFINTNKELGQRQQQLDIALNESEWGIKAIKAEMSQYVSVGPLFAEDGKTIIGATGLRWDPETGKYVTERLENVPVSVAKLMVQQQIMELEGNEQDNIIKAQGYSGLAATVYGTIMNKKIPSIDTPEAWSSTAYMYAEKYAEGKEDVTPESAYGRILAHAYNRGWIDKDLIPNESLLYTDEANTAFNKEQETWAKENPKTTKIEDTTPSTNPNLMSGGLQAMTPEDNQIKSLFNLLLGNDTLYNNLKSAVTIPEQASNMTLGQALSDMNFSGPISRLEDLAGGGAGRRLDEYTKGVERRPTGNTPTGLSPTWKDVLDAFGLGGGKGQ